MSETNRGGAKRIDNPPNAASIIGVSAPADSAREPIGGSGCTPHEVAAGAGPLPVADPKAAGELQLTTSKLFRRITVREAYECPVLDFSMNGGDMGGVTKVPSSYKANGSRVCSQNLL